MIKPRTTNGKSVALIIDKTALELLEITMKAPLKISTDSNSLITSPLASTERNQRVREAMKQVNERHADTLRKLGK